MSDRQLRTEAVRYFRERPVLMAAAKRFCQKYRSLGHWGGRICLRNLGTEDRQVLSAFLRRAAVDSVTLTYTEFLAAWGKTRFAEVPLGEVLGTLYPERLTTRQQEAQGQEQRRQRLLIRLLQLYPAGPAGQWLEALMMHHVRLGSPADYERRELLEPVVRALSMLPQTYERLPFFANRVCGNPHGLDIDAETGRLFLRALAYLAGYADTGSLSMVVKNELLYDQHILREDILNFATAYGLRAWSVDGEEILYWREAAIVRAPLNVPLREIVRVGQFASCRKTAGALRVFIVENAGVFSTLLDSLQAEDGLCVPLLCLHGQLKTASWALLDRLAASGAALFYSGDFDPEGLLMADKILQRYPGAQAWHFTEEEYGSSKVVIPDSRLKKLEQVISPALAPLVSALRQRRQAFYQESLVSRLWQDLQLEGRL
ncbi:MAG: DUF2399 domain-containing protein [Selenomonas sp.]|nr:DUF2399 domain-containing protein [Selenomonas sp.]